MSKKTNPKSWAQKGPEERFVFERSLEGLSIMRRTGKSLTEVSRELGLSRRTVLTNIGPALKKVGRRWRPKQYDRLPRPPMNIIEEGRLQTITVNDSREASKIGRYFSAVGIYLDKADPVPLQKFKGVRVRDSEGELHTLDADPEIVRDVVERSEPEAPEPYRV